MKLNKLKLLYIILIIGISSTASASVEFINITPYSSKELRSEIEGQLQNLSDSSIQFATLWRTLSESNLQYNILLADDRFRKIFMPKLFDQEKKGDILPGGAFTPPVESEKQFSGCANLKNAGGMEKVCQKISGNPLIVFHYYVTNINGTDYLNILDNSVLAQEFFHAYQYEYYTNMGHQVEVFQDVRQSRKLVEVEGDLATYAFIDDFSQDNGKSKYLKFLKINFSGELLDLVKGELCHVEGCSKENFNTTLNQIWDTMRNTPYLENFYSTTNSKNLKIEDLKALDSLFNFLDR